MLANGEGSWEPNEQLAFVLLANNQASPATKLQGFQVIASLFSQVGSMLVGAFVTGESSGTGEEAAAGVMLAKNARALVKRRSSAKQPPQHQQTEDERSAAAWDNDDATFTLDDGAEEDVHEGNADPLSFSAAAILGAMPAALTPALGGDTALAGRVWATCLVAAFLESNAMYGWRVSARTTPLTEQRTLLDIAQAWASTQLAAVPDDNLLPDVAHAARLQVRRWAKLHDRRVTSSRGAHIATREHVKLRMRSAACTVHSTLVNGHPFVSLFTSELSIGFARWMGMNVFVSALMAMLVVRARELRCPCRCICAF